MRWSWRTCKRPALVITDIVLPRRSGYDLCRALRLRFGQMLPILFLSGVRTQPFDVEAGLLLGADDYIVKPFVANELVARVRRSPARTAASFDR
jgi:DNA-binding response OmpR family regulator